MEDKIHRALSLAIGDLFLFHSFSDIDMYGLSTSHRTGFFGLLESDDISLRDQQWR